MSKHHQARDCIALLLSLTLVTGLLPASALAEVSEGQTDAEIVQALRAEVGEDCKLGPVPNTGDVPQVDGFASADEVVAATDEANGIDETSATDTATDVDATQVDEPTATDSTDPAGPSAVDDGIPAAEPRDIVATSDPVDLSSDSAVAMENTDAYDLANAEAYLLGSLWHEDDGKANIPVYLLQDGSARPGVDVEVEIDGEEVWLREGVDYTLRYEGNDHESAQGETAQAIIEGIGAYHGSISVPFIVIEKIDLARCTKYSIFDIAAGLVWQTHEPYGETDDNDIRFLATGGPLRPRVEFWSATKLEPQQGIDFEVSYLYDDGTAAPVQLESVTDPGSYLLVMTAIEGGSCVGTATIPFALDATFTITDENSYAWVGNYQSHNYDEDYNEETGEVFTFHEVLSDLSSVVWAINTLGNKLIENLDYQVQTVFNEKSGGWTTILQGVGSYAGSLMVQAYTSTNATEALSSRTILINGATESPEVALTTTGGIVAPVVTVEGLAYGVDYVAMVINSANQPTYTAKNGARLKVRILGKGAYKGAKVDKAVVARASKTNDLNSLSEDNVDFVLTNGVCVSEGNEGFVWYLLRSAASRPEEKLTVRRAYTVELQRGTDYTVSTSVLGDELQIRATAKKGANSLAQGSNTYVVKLVDSFLMDKHTSRVIVTDANDVTDFWIEGEDGMDDSLVLSYQDAPYVPSVKVYTASIDGVAPTYQSTLLDKSGETVEQVSGPGRYTLVLEGTGDWSGSMRIPLRVRQDAVETDVDLSLCRMVLGTNTELVDGVAKPSVELSYRGTTLVEGVDYSLSYGSNTETGGRAWVKATALAGSHYSGIAKASFVVAGANKVLNQDDYVLELKLPSGDGYDDANQLRLYRLKPRTQIGPEVRLMARARYQNTQDIRTEVPSSNYKVTYTNVGQTGLASVTVTGVGSYSGSLSANFYVHSTQDLAEASLTLSKASMPYSGKAQKPLNAVKIGNKTLKANTDYTVEYSNNKAVGTATITVTGKGNYSGTRTATFTITKAEQTGFKASSPFTKKNPKVIKKSALKRTNTLKKDQWLNLTKATGKLSYKKASGSKYLSVNKSNGTISVAKNAPAGTYSINVQVTAAGNASFKSVKKSVLVSIAVK